MKPVEMFKKSVASLNRTNPNILVFITYGLLYDTFLNIYKPFAMKFLERLGGTDFHIALYNAVPGLSALVLLPGAILISRQKKKKKITTIFFIVSRLFILVIAFVPFFPVHLQPLLFILFISTMNLPEAVAQTSLQNFLGTIFDGRLRAKAITLRNKFGNVAIPLITLISGLIIGIFPKNNAERIMYYQIFYVVAFFVSLLEIRTFTKFKEKPLDELPPRIGFAEIKKIIAEPKFFHFLCTTMVFQFIWQAGWPMSTIYQIKTLRADEIWLAVFAVASGTASFFSAGYWNKFIQKHGNDKALVVAVFFMGVNMFTIGLSPNLYWMTLASVYSGVSTIGLTVTMLNGLLGATPDENRIIAIGIYNTFVNISLFISPFFSNAILERMGIVNTMMIVGTGRLLSGVVLLIDYKITRAKLSKA